MKLFATIFSLVCFSNQWCSACALFYRRNVVSDNFVFIHRCFTCFKISFSSHASRNLLWWITWRGERFHLLEFDSIFKLRFKVTKWSFAKISKEKRRQNAPRVHLLSVPLLLPINESFHLFLINLRRKKAIKLESIWIASIEIYCEFFAVRGSEVISVWIETSREFNRTWGMISMNKLTKIESTI